MNDRTTDTSTALTVRRPDEDTWPTFARLVEANNGIWGGCWCMGFHVRLGKGRTPQQNRDERSTSASARARRTPRSAAHSPRSPA